MFSKRWKLAVVHFLTAALLCTIVYPHSASAAVESYYVASPNPYSNNMNQTWAISKAGATSIRVYFSTIDTESGYDYVTTSSGNSWSGSYSGLWSTWASGSSISVTLKTDVSIVKSGFTITQIEYMLSSGDVVRDRFASSYSPSRFNNTTGTTNNEYLQTRMNCYGYALQIFYSGSTQLPYLQQPGDFRRSSDANNVQSLSSSESPSLMMSKVVNNIKYDASRMGYTVTEYTLPASGIPAQFGTNKRLVALVTGNNTPYGFTDYHWYMQHSDGTWSHKPGSTSVTNLAADDQVQLTNSNIASKANQGYYKNGQLKFFTITKDAVTDYPHGDFNSSNEIQLNFGAAAGEDRVTAVSMATPTTTTNSLYAAFDFREDRDVFYFTVPATGAYNFSTSSGVDADGKVWVGNTSSPLVTDGNSGEVNMAASLIAGQTVYVEIYNYSKTRVPYTLSFRRVS